jgi:hypothetical protein
MPTSNIDPLTRARLPPVPRRRPQALIRSEVLSLRESSAVRGQFKIHHVQYEGSIYPLEV